MNKELTPKQRNVYLNIKEYISKNKYSPSIRELCLLCNVSSSATIFAHLNKLEDKGYITHISGSRRTIQIIKELED